MLMNEIEEFFGTLRIPPYFRVIPTTLDKNEDNLRATDGAPQSIEDLDTATRVPLEDAEIIQFAHASTDPDSGAPFSTSIVVPMADFHETDRKEALELIGTGLLQAVHHDVFEYVKLGDERWVEPHKTPTIFSPTSWNDPFMPHRHAEPSVDDLLAQIFGSAK